MNRDTRLERSDTLVVVDRSRRNRNLLIATALTIAVLIGAFFLMRSNEPAPGAAATGSGVGGGDFSLLIGGVTEIIADSPPNALVPEQRHCGGAGCCLPIAEDRLITAHC